MPSQRIRNRLDQIPATVGAAFAASDVVGEAIRRQAQSPADRAAWTGIGDLCADLGHEIERRGQRMLAADRALEYARAEGRRLQRRRDRLTQRLYSEMVDVRRRIKTILGRQRGAEYLRFLGGATSRDPVVLQRQARECFSVLTDPRSAPPASPVRGIVHHWEQVAKPLRSLADELDHAIADVYSAHAGITSALADQRAAIDAFDHLYKRGARFLEALLDLAGLPTLAEMVRPGVGWRGRPRKTRRVDEHPDLVQRALASGLLEDSAPAQGVRGLSEDLEDAERVVPETPAAGEKSRQALSELPGGDEKIRQPLRELPAGDEKSDQRLRELPESTEKSGQGLHKYEEDGVSDSSSTDTRRRRLRKRIVLGLGNRISPRLRSSGVTEEVPVKRWPLREVRETASGWWKRLRRAA